MTSDLDIVCQRLTVAELPALIAFMEGAAFADNPHWRTCYCVFHYLSDSRDGAWQGHSGDANRLLLTEMVEAARGHWILAYHHDRIVGWVNADMRPQLRRYDEWGTVNDDRTGMVACFVVDPAFRRSGVARQLLDAAVQALAQMGARHVDAHVVGDPADVAASVEEAELGPDQMAHHGPISMYLKARFRVIGENGPIIHVRRNLD